MLFLGHIQQEPKKTCYELVKGDVKGEKKDMIDFTIVESALTMLVKGRADSEIIRLLE